MSQWQPQDPEQLPMWEDEDPIEQLMSAEAEEPEQPPEKGHRLLKAFLLFLFFLVLAGYVAQRHVFVLKRLEVKGLVYRPAQEVVYQAGLRGPISLLTLDIKTIKDNLASSRLFSYVDHQTILPDTLILTVKERVAKVRVKYIGILYVVADDGMVLARTRDMSNYGSLPTVSGLVLREILEGTVPQTTPPQQMTALLNLMAVMPDRDNVLQILDINLAEPENIYLSTRDGFTIHLGDANYLGPKLATVRAVLSELHKRQMTGGVIEATIPGEATYRPDTL